MFNRKRHLPIIGTVHLGMYVLVVLGSVLFRDPMVYAHGSVTEDSCARPGQLVVRPDRTALQRPLRPMDFFTVVALAGENLFLADCTPRVDSQGNQWLVIRAILHFDGVMTKRLPETGQWQTSWGSGVTDHPLTGTGPESGHGVCIQATLKCRVSLAGDQSGDAELAIFATIPTTFVTGQLTWLRQEMLQRIY